MIERYIDVGELPAVVRKSSTLLDLLGKALELCWWDGFYRGLVLATLGYAVAIGLVYAIARVRR